MPLIQAELFRIGDVIYAAPYVLKPSIIATASRTDETEIGAKALEALEASATGDRPDPALFTRATQERWRVPLLQASGYASLDAFEAAAQYILLDHSIQDFVLLPSRRGKPGERYTYLHRKMMTFRVKDSRELGIAIVRGFALCEDDVPPVITPGIAGEILGLAVPPFAGLHARTVDGKSEFVVADGAPNASFVDLLRWLPPNCELNYFDPNYPRISDPGAYVSVVKHGEEVAIHRANHGWSSDWEVQTSEVVAELLRRSTDARAIEKGGQPKIEIRLLPGPANVGIPGTPKYRLG